MIDKLKSIESYISTLLNNPSIWNTLDIDYYPPRVERLWTKIDDDTRLYIHVIHPTNEACLFHKHRWPSAFKIIEGEYEMGISYSDEEVTSEEAYKLPVISKFIMSKESYYEMVNTNTLHYVRPLGKPSISLMITGKLYKESSFRKESLNKELSPLSEERKIEILNSLIFIYK